MEVERDGIGSSRDHRRQHQRPGDHDPVAAGSAEPAQAAVPAAPAGTAAMRGTRQARRSGASGDAIAWSPTLSRESRPLEDERAIVRIAAPGRLRLGESASPLLAARSLIQTIALSPMRSPAQSCPGDRIPSKAIVPRPHSALLRLGELRSEKATAYQRDPDERFPGKRSRGAVTRGGSPSHGLVARRRWAGASSHAEA